MSAGRASFRVPPRPEMPGEGPVSAGRAVRSLCVAPPAPDDGLGTAPRNPILQGALEVGPCKRGQTPPVARMSYPSARMTAEG